MPMALNRRFISTYRYAEVVISRDLRLHALDEGLGAQVALVLELGPGGWVVLAFGHEGSIALNSAPALPREGGKQPVGVQPWRRLRQAGRGSIAAPAGKRQDPSCRQLHSCMVLTATATSRSTRSGRKSRPAARMPLTRAIKGTWLASITPPTAVVLSPVFSRLGATRGCPGEARRPPFPRFTCSRYRLLAASRLGPDR